MRVHQREPTWVRPLVWNGKRAGELVGRINVNGGFSFGRGGVSEAIDRQTRAKNLTNAGVTKVAISDSPTVAHGQIKVKHEMKVISSDMHDNRLRRHKYEE